MTKFQWPDESCVEEEAVELGDVGGTGKRVYAIPKDWLLNFLRVSQGHHTMLEAEIPVDAEIVGVDYDPTQDMLRLVVKSKQFYDRHATDTYAISSVVW